MENARLRTVLDESTVPNLVGYFAHPTAAIDDGARIGTGTRIWHFCHVMPGAVIGSDCNLGMGVFVDNGVRIGDRVKIQNNVSVYDGVELEDDVFCGPSVVFTNVLNPRAHVDRKDEFRRTLVRRGATLGANSTIVCGHEIGEYAFVGAGAVVASDIPAYALTVGSPARRIGWACNCGVRLHPEPEDGATFTCNACGAGYAEEDGGLHPVSAQ